MRATQGDTQAHKQRRVTDAQAIQGDMRTSSMPRTMRSLGGTSRASWGPLGDFLVASGGLLTASRALLDVVEASWVVKWPPVAVFGGPIRSLWRREEKTAWSPGGLLGMGLQVFWKPSTGRRWACFGSGWRGRRLECHNKTKSRSGEERGDSGWEEV